MWKKTLRASVCVCEKIIKIKKREEKQKWNYRDELRKEKKRKKKWKKNKEEERKIYNGGNGKKICWPVREVLFFV